MNPIDTTQLIDQLTWRYATKLFDDTRPIPADTWQELEHALILTPSSFGLQPWHFIVVTNPELKEKLRASSWNQPQVTTCSHYLILAAKTHIDENDIDTFIQRVAQTTEAPADSLTGYRDIMANFINAMSAEDRIQWARHQSYIALGQIMASAALLGIDACPMEGFIPGEYDQLLDLPAQNLTASVACAFGYRSPEDKYAHTPKTRFRPDELITHHP